jgi:DNA mismatch repair protein MutS
MHLTGGICEKCKSKIATDVHHMMYQRDADEKGRIKKDTEGLSFSKNSKANLVNLCERCHDQIHKEGKISKRIKTSVGIKIVEY